MKKTVVLVCVGVLLLVCIIGAIYFIFFNKPVKPIIQNTFDNRRIVYQKEIDLDNDGIPEKVVLDNEPMNLPPDEKPEDSDEYYQYKRLLIYKLEQTQWKLVFDSVAAGVTDFWGRLDHEKHDIRIADDNHNGLPEIYMEAPAGSRVSETAIIEMVGRKFEIVFSGPLSSWEYKDFDNDGVFEMYGITSIYHGGENPFDTNLWTVFIRKDNKYQPSYKLTKQYIQSMVDEGEYEFQIDPSLERTCNLLSIYILAADREKFKRFAEEHWDELVNAGLVPVKTVDELMERNDQPFIRTTEWLESLKKYGL